MPEPARERDREIGRRALRGTAQVSLAQMILFPSGIVTAAVLTRSLGPDGYGLFVLAATTTAWAQWTVASLFSRAAIKLIGEAEEWRVPARLTVQLSLVTGLVVGAALATASGPIASLLDAPRLATYLALFAIDVPLFALARGHMDVLTALERHGRRATSIAVYWLVRMVLIVLLVGLGFSVTGAIVGSIGATLAHLVVLLGYDRPRLLARAGFSARSVFRYAGPIFLYSTAIRIFGRLDLFMLKGLGGTTAQAGLYGSAQNASLIMGSFGGSFSPPLLASVTRLLAAGEIAHARDMGRDAMRLAFMLLPFAGIAAGSAREILVLVFGVPFAPAARVLPLLLFADVGFVLVRVATSLVTAGGRPGWTFAVTGPLVPLAFTGHLFAIPRWSAVGAATVTVVGAWIGVASAMVALRRAGWTLPPARTIVRCGILAALAWAAAAAWSTPGWWVIVKVGALGLAVPLGLLLTREIGAREIELVRSLFPLQSPASRRSATRL